MGTAEDTRLAALASLRVLDTPPERVFDDLVELAARLAGTPTALVTLVDDSRQWFKARTGLDVAQTPRDVALCDVVVRTDGELEVEDARADPRFADNPLVTGPPHVVFYSGFPLRLSDGAVVGALCVIGPQPRRLDADQRRALRVLATQVSAQLELRRRTAELEASRRSYAVLAEHATDIVSRLTPTGEVTYVSPAVRTVLGRDPAQEVGAVPSGVHPDDQPLLERALAGVAEGRTETVTVRTRHADGSWRHLETTLSPLLDENGVVEVYSAARDVTERVGVTAELTAALALSRAVLDSISVGVVACDADGRLTQFNGAARDFHGLSADGDLDPAAWPRHDDLLLPDGRTPLPPDQVPLRRALRGEPVEDVEMVIAPQGLPARLVSCTGRALRDAAGAVTGAVVVMRDITATRESERRLRRAADALRQSNEALSRREAQFREIFERGPMPMCRLDEDGVLVQVNPALRRLLALPSSKALGARLESFAVPTDREHLALTVATAQASARSHVVEVRLRVADGRSTWCEVTMSASRDEDGRGSVFVQLADVDARKRRELDLERRAAHDALTGLPNRAALEQHLSDALGDEAGVGVVYLDLDGFKGINDTLGHAVGDEVLVEVARRLSATVRSGDLVGRLGGDEFVLVHRSRDGVGSLAALAARVRRQLAPEVATTVGPLAVGVSLGTATASADEALPGLLARADAAMYADKRRRRAAR